MHANWLWDSRISQKEVKRILRDTENPRFVIYAEKMLSRVSNPATVFSLIGKVDFCKKWPAIKKRMVKNKWAHSKAIFWQTAYDRLLERFQQEGVKIRKIQARAVPLPRAQLARQIRDIRKKLGYTQTDFAKKLGVIQQYISKIETGRENVSIDTLKRIAKALGRKLTIKL